MAALRANLENNITPESILAAPTTAPATPGSREWAIRELRRYRDEHLAPQEIEEMLNMETGPVNDTDPFIEHNYNILPSAGPYSARKLKEEAFGRNIILEKGTKINRTNANEVAELKKTEEDIFQTLMSIPDVQQYLTLTYPGITLATLSAHPQAVAMLERIIDSSRFQASVRNRVKEGIAAEKAIPADVMQAALVKQKERDDKEREVNRLKTEQKDVTSKTSPTGLKKVRDKYEDDYVKVAVGNKREALININKTVRTKQTVLAGAEADEDSIQRKVDTLLKQIQEAERQKDRVRVADLRADYDGTSGNTDVANLKKAKEKVAKIKGEIEDAKTDQAKLFAEQAEREKEKTNLEGREKALPDEIKVAEDDFKRLDKEYEQAVKPIEQQAAAYQHELQQAYKKGAAEWIARNREVANAARQSIIQEEIEKSKDALSRVVGEVLTTRWSKKITKGRRSTVKPDITKIKEDYEKLIDPSEGVNSLMRTILKDNQGQIPDLQAYVHTQQLKLGRRLTFAEHDQFVDEWCRTNAEEVDALKAELSSSIMWERWQHGSLMHGKKPIPPHEAEFILKQKGGEQAFNDMITKNVRLQELNKKLIASGIERNNLFDWYYKASGGNIAIFLALLFGTAALGGLGVAGGVAGAGALGIHGLVGLSAGGVVGGGATGSIVPSILGVNQR